MCSEFGLLLAIQIFRDSASPLWGGARIDWRCWSAQSNPSFPLVPGPVRPSPIPVQSLECKRAVWMKRCSGPIAVRAILSLRLVPPRRRRIGWPVFGDPLCLQGWSGRWLSSPVDSDEAKGFFLPRRQPVQIAQESSPPRASFRWLLMSS